MSPVEPGAQRGLNRVSVQNEIIDLALVFICIRDDEPRRARGSTQAQRDLNAVMFLEGRNKGCARAELGGEYLILTGGSGGRWDKGERLPK